MTGVIEVAAILLLAKNTSFEKSLDVKRIDPPVDSLVFLSYLTSLTGCNSIMNTRCWIRTDSTRMTRTNVTTSNAIRSYQAPNGNVNRARFFFVRLEFEFDEDEGSWSWLVLLCSSSLSSWASISFSIITARERESLIRLVSTKEKSRINPKVVCFDRASGALSNSETHLSTCALVSFDVLPWDALAPSCERVT